ncbi:hypothetical protein BH09BAC3_BH09BAC3_36680 [soil metagenome]
MKSVLVLIFFAFIISDGVCQPTGNDDVTDQIKKIVAAAETNFSTLKQGSGQKIDTNLQYPSTLEINNTDKHSISISLDGKSATYIIPVSSSLNKEQTNKLYRTWNRNIAAALGSAFEKNCIPIHLGAIAQGEQCDYISIKQVNISVTIANVYSADTSTSSLDVYVRNEPE